MENKIILNGKIYRLVEEEATESVKDNNPFTVTDKEEYFLILDNGHIVNTIFDSQNAGDIERNWNANMCKDRELIRQRAMKETLDRRLWRASISAGERKNKWNGLNEHYYITMRFVDDVPEFTVHSATGGKIQGVVYFPTRPSAAKAIEDIVNPFVANHPDFVL